MLAWPPAAFWASTPHELEAALEMWRVAHGGAPDPERVADFARFRRAVEAGTKKR